jgi:geranylgeranyl pyrophosphate synthase
MYFPNVLSVEQDYITPLKRYLVTVQLLNDWPEFRDWFLENLEKDRGWQLTLPFLSSAALGGKPDRVLPLAAAWSMLRYVAYLADDYLDGELEEKGRNAKPHQVFGFVSAGTFLSFRLLSSLQEPSEAHRIVTVFAEAGFHSTLGMEMEFSNEPYGKPVMPVLENYWKSVIDKSGSIYRAAAAGGAILAGANETQVKALAEYGSALGVLRQVLDDCRDIWEQSRGPVGELSLPLLMYKLVEGKQILNESEIKELLLGPRDHLYLMFEKTKVPELLSDILMEWRRRALDCLVLLPESAERDTLAALPDQILSG